MTLLPKEFSELEPFAATWCLPTERQRFAQRMASSMDEIQAFYDAFYPRAEEAIAYCDKFPLDDLPDDARALVHLMQSFVMVTFPIEVWKQPRVPDSGAAYVAVTVEPVV